MSIRFRLSMLAVLVLICASMSAQDTGEEKDWSPDNSLYAVRLQGETVGKGQARERFEIHAADGKKVSTVYIWSVEPDGSQRVGIRGCEDTGWIASNRFYCQGSGNPSMGIYLYFDARTGREMGELIGSEFTWSPDNSRIANFGNVPHFIDWDKKSDSLEIGKYRYPDERDTDRHLFRSGITWSPDSQKVAIVDHRMSDNGFYLVVMRADTGKQFIKHLEYAGGEGQDDWPARHDFFLQWNGNQINVKPLSGTPEVIAVR